MFLYFAPANRRYFRCFCRHPFSSPFRKEQKCKITNKRKSVHLRFSIDWISSAQRRAGKFRGLATVFTIWIDYLWRSWSNSTMSNENIHCTLAIRNSFWPIFDFILVLPAGDGDHLSAFVSTNLCTTWNDRGINLCCWLGNRKSMQINKNNSNANYSRQLGHSEFRLTLTASCTSVLFDFGTRKWRIQSHARCCCETHAMRICLGRVLLSEHMQTVISGWQKSIFLSISRNISIFDGRETGWFSSIAIPSSQM